MRPTNEDGSALSDEQLEQAAGGLITGSIMSPLCANLTVKLDTVVRT